jgi:RNA polymerase sigma-70 factor (ECF subfamily)
MAAVALSPLSAPARSQRCGRVSEYGLVSCTVVDLSGSADSSTGYLAPLPASRDAADRADLAAVCHGDRDALARLYERHQEALFGFVLRLTASDRMLAEEALQDTLMAVWMNASSFAGESQVRTWIWSIARRNTLSKLRKKRPDPVDPEAAIPVIDSGPSPDDQALARVDAGVLSGLIDQLPEQLRVTLVLAFVEDLPYPEISAVLDVPVGTVKSRVSRARAALVALAREARVLP